MTKTGDVFKSNYLQASDLGDRQWTLVISHYEIEEMNSRQTGRKQEKPVLFFRGVKKGLVLNKTNTKTIEHVYGDELDDWIGRSVTLYPRMVDFGGEEVLGIRVRIPTQGQATVPAHRQPQPAFASGLPDAPLGGDPAPAPRQPAATHPGYDERNPPPLGETSAQRRRDDMDDEIPF